MMTDEQRIERLTQALRAAADGDLDPASFAAQAHDALGEAESALGRLLEALSNRNSESSSAISSLANANVRLLLWNEALQKVNQADNLLYHGGDSEAFYRQIVGDAMEMTRARYGALGLYDREGKVIRFVTIGMDEATIAKLGRPPVGRGLLGAILREPGVLRVNDIGAHPESCGFPEGHPPMKTLIGIPLRIAGKVKGALYLADKEGGELFGESPQRIADVFADEDEIMLALFGDYLARALERIQLTKMLQDSNAELQHTVKRLNEAQNQLLQSEKMASIGQLAAGVAHEINNPIGFINSNVGSLERYLKSLFAILDAYERAQEGCGTPCIDYVEVEALKKQLDFDFLKEDIFTLMRETRDGVARVTKIVQDLKDFSHVDEAEWQRVDVHKGLDSTLNVVWNELKYKAEVVKEYGELPEIECLPGQLNQVFMNLLVNAAHAIQERGRITLRTDCGEEEVWVEVADTGCGILPENMTRIFDPFFTTKPVGKGTGLGLSLSYGIVQKHHGRMEVTSEVGRGSTFRVVLPVVQPPASGEKTE